MNQSSEEYTQALYDYFKLIYDVWKYQQYEGANNNQKGQIGTSL